jgi:AcrR family transcriptional regulator
MSQRHRTGESSRESILDAAEQLMAAHGFAGASISLIEEESGLPASSIYWHFGSKDGVLLAVMQRGADRFFASLPHAADFDGTPVERIHAGLATAARLLDEHPQFLQLLITLGLQHTGGDPQVVELVREVRRRALERLEEGILAALEDLPEADRPAVAAEMARFALALADGAFIASHIDEGVDLETTFGQLGTALAGMVAARTHVG